MEKQHNDRQNGAKLDHHIKHFHKAFRSIQGQDLFQQDQMARGGNGKPFRNALHNAVYNGL